MSLKGSLQTVALPEVLRFLSGTGKSGEFHVSGTNGDGRLWFTDGRVSGFQAARAAEPHEAIFQMLRISDGDFDFTADRPRPDDAHAVDAVDLDSTIEAAEHRMAEWMRIVEVVPSLSHGLNLRAEAPEGRIELEPGQWMTIVTVARGGTVGQVIDERGMQEFDGSQQGREDAAAIDIAYQQAGRIGGLRHAHVHDIVRLQVDLGNAPRTLDHDEVAPGTEPVEALPHPFERLGLVGVVLPDRHVPDRPPLDDHLAPGVGVRLQKHRVHVGVGRDAARLRLHRLRPADLPPPRA